MGQVMLGEEKDGMALAGTLRLGKVIGTGRDRTG